MRDLLERRFRPPATKTGEADSGMHP